MIDKPESIEKLKDQELREDLYKVHSFSIEKLKNPELKKDLHKVIFFGRCLWIYTGLRVAVPTLQRHLAYKKINYALRTHIDPQCDLKTMPIEQAMLYVAAYECKPYFNNLRNAAYKKSSLDVLQHACFPCAEHIKSEAGVAAALSELSGCNVAIETDSSGAGLVVTRKDESEFYREGDDYNYFAVYRMIVRL